ncbi:cell wall metabolism sensor histidine kinase WalK [Tetragenococcus halophilus]|uniref:histidine kinase n=2 Tax=Tetragenococcus halophilus TaxID=51669 RepID=A0A2H6CUT8_TETHA|nr:cell wall metabolism sensor histidine kinase WalK [Tetragenococcus halophilus]AOF48589.1 histidine kinase [Tetragenococcus halophilus]MCO8289714.1 cell wall metabolism sensor histidine kinase WalK [Tetragenococcus halophilus]MCO8293868.1 cell wall metabolism sensor histidine kinase WalK [Tetragenococcus halophilus]MCO8298161.1 cell wall metabolism sensor histidine kinase WalK [Tetragenococcus halophilus]NWO00662.1 cell wall metabolism sensor histidine kinase WalK [Tetragenococcus halophilus
MKKKVRFFRSVNFKIALTFILVLLVSIEIIGAYFIRGLERSTIESFKSNMDTQAETLASTLGNHLGSPDDEDSGQQNDELQRVLDNSDSSDVLEMKVVDEKNNIRATTNVAERYTVGKKNDDPYIDDFSTKSLVAVDDETSNRVQINVQPIQTTGDTVAGALYIRSDLEQQYEEINDIALIFITSSVIAVFISMIVAVLVARSITQPIAEMRQQALRIAKGDYSRKVQVKGNDELGELAATFNQLGERIEETQEAMESERNRLNSVLSHMTDGVVATDRRGKVITINEMALSLLNVERESAVNQSILTLFDMGEDYTLRKILENPEEILLERPSADKNLDNVLLRVDFSMIRRDSGFISGLVAVLHDVTEQEKTEQERREFVSNVSHELRTPLTSTRSYIEALSEGAWKDEEIAPKFLNVTLNETDRMIRMINDLLSLSRMDSGNYQLQAEYINFKELVNFVLDRFDMMVDEQEKKYHIKRDFTKRELWVEVDTDRMIQVIDNLMNNAVKYSPDGGIITVRLVETHNNIILSITDQGLGIPPNDINKVFDRFYRVDKARARKQGGTGLGLAISKEVLKVHGGNIWVESREHVGSTFFVSLPYEPYEEDWWE